MTENFEIQLIKSNINKEEAEDRLFRALSMLLNDNDYGELLREHLLNERL